MTELLTAEGKKYARYAFLTYRFLNHRFVRRIPIVRSIARFGISFTASFCYTVILKEGEKEQQLYARRKKAEVSRMRNGISFDRRETSEKMREVRFSDSGGEAIRPLHGCVLQKQENPDAEN
jgi:hypothetical protein